MNSNNMDFKGEAEVEDLEDSDPPASLKLQRLGIEELDELAAEKFASASTTEGEPMATETLKHLLRQKGDKDLEKVKVSPAIYGADLEMNSIQLELASASGPAMKNSASVTDEEEAVKEEEEAAKTLVHLLRLKQKQKGNMTTIKLATKAELEGSKDLREVEGSKESGKNPAAAANEGHCLKGEVFMHENGGKPVVNFANLETETLRSYCKFYKIGVINSSSTREQLLNIVEEHFASSPSLTEQDVIPELVGKLQKGKKPAKTRSIKELYAATANLSAH